MGVVEVNGEGFHSDDLTFKKETGRTAALESMGYSVVSFTYDQVSVWKSTTRLSRSARRRSG